MAETLGHGIEVISTGAALGAEIRGLDLGDVDRETFEAIRTVWHRHLVVVFRDQDLAADLSRLSRRFGELDPAPGDLVVWDNRCTLHRRDAFDADARRLMPRTQVKGSRPV